MPRAIKQPPILISWISALIVLGVVVWGWQTGRPLTPEVIGVLAAFWGWAVRTTLWSREQIAAHDDALRQIAETTDTSPDEVRTIYDQVYRETKKRAEDSALARKKTPQKRRTPK